MAKIGFEEPLTEPTLIRWRPSDLRILTEFCAGVGIDRASFVRGVALAVVSKPWRAIELLDLPPHVQDAIVQTTLPLGSSLEGPPGAGKPAQDAKSPRKGTRRGGRR